MYRERLLRNIRYYFRKYKFLLYNLLIILSIVVFFIILPEIIKLYDNNKLEFIKLVISFTGPILTFIVFTNTLKIQKAQRVEKKYDMTFTEFYKLLEIYSEVQRKEIKKINDLEKEIKQEFNFNFYNLANWGNELSVVSKNIFRRKTGEFGHYFRVVHRIIKTLNNRLENGDIKFEEYQSFIGIMRMQITAKEFFVLYVNSVFSSTGYGSGVQFIGSGFFDGVDILKDLDIDLSQDVISLLHENQAENYEYILNKNKYKKIEDLFRLSDHGARKRSIYLIFSDASKDGQNLFDSILI